MIRITLQTWVTPHHVDRVGTLSRRPRCPSLSTSHRWSLCWPVRWRCCIGRPRAIRSGRRVRFRRASWPPICDAWLTTRPCRSPWRSCCTGWPTNGPSVLRAQPMGGTKSATGCRARPCIEHLGQQTRGNTDGRLPCYLPPMGARSAPRRARPTGVGAGGCAFEQRGGAPARTSVGASHRVAVGAARPGFGGRKRTINRHAGMCDGARGGVFDGMPRTWSPVAGPRWALPPRWCRVPQRAGSCGRSTRAVRACDG